MSNRAGKRRRFSWRRLNVALHRDLGYLLVGLTIVYAISGIAVNHAFEWNASYSTTFEERRVDADLGGPTTEAADRLLDELELEGDWVAFAQDQGETIYVGFKDRILTVRARVATGEVEIERKHPRWILREMNQLHLNEPQGPWTWIADGYAALLLVLAGSGILILRGKKGIGGRGKWLIAAGLLIPVLGYAYWAVIG